MRCPGRALAILAPAHPQRPAKTLKGQRSTGTPSVTEFGMCSNSTMCWQRVEAVGAGFQNEHVGAACHLRRGNFLRLQLRFKFEAIAVARPCAHEAASPERWCMSSS